MSWWKPTTNEQLALLLYEVLLNQERIISNQTQGTRSMSAISDAVATLKTKLDNEGVQIGVLLTFLQTINQQLKDALANSADADAAVAAIAGLSAEVDTQVQQIQGANPPPAPTQSP